MKRRSLIDARRPSSGWIRRSVLVCAWLAGGAVAHAAQPRGAAASGSAVAVPASRFDTLLEHGMDSRRLGKDEEALSAFAAAAALEPESVRVRVHLAATHQALGHWQEADVLLREVLQEADDPYVQRHRATLERAAEFVARHLGSLLVTGKPEGAVVQVDGRTLGTLPLSEAVRLPVGSYQLEVVRQGYYPIRRPLAVTAGGLLRESVQLAPLSPADPVPVQGVRASEDARASGGSPVWLSWTLTGLAAGAAVTSGVALAVRNQHAERWNSAACLEGGRRRGEVCADELDAGKDAELWAYGSAIASVLFGAAAVISWTLPGAEAPSAGVALSGCRLTLSGGVCSGSF